MPKYQLPQIYQISDLPEFHRLIAANPDEELKANQVAAMYSTAINWFAIIGTIWPDFEKNNYISIEVGYILNGDPERENYPEDLYKQIAEMIAMFWRIQLEDLYPHRKWSVEVRDDPEVTVVAEIIQQKCNRQAKE
jgi:hypothetical protein